MPTAPPLGVRTKMAFGSGSAAEAAVVIAFNSFNFLYYNQARGLSGTLAGLAVTIALVFDAVSDPLIGSLSDRWKSKLGRRHPFMFFSALPYGLCFFLIYMPPEGLSGLGLFAWFTVFSVLLRTCQTLYHVPHLALGAELSEDYRERSVIMSYNAIFQVVGGASAYFFGWTHFASIEGGASVSTGYPTLGIGVGVFAALAILASAQLTRDRIPYLSSPPDMPRFALRELFLEVVKCLKNRNYLMLVLGYFFLSATTGTRETLEPYLGLFYWELPETKMRYFGLASPPGFVLAFVLTARLHVWFSKRATMRVAIVAMVVAFVAPIFLRMAGFMPENGDPALFPYLMLAVFTYYSGFAVMTISVMSALADVSDEHELATGRRQEGVFYSARTFFSKLTSGLGHLLGGVAIDVIGFPDNAQPGEVPPDVLFDLGLVCGPLIAIPALVSLVFYARYGIDARKHAQIREELARKREL